MLENPFPSATWASWSILSEGQREGKVEVLEIHPETAMVKVRLFPNGDPTNLTFTNLPAPHRGMSAGTVLENASLEPVLGLYGELSGRSLLCAQALPNISLTIAIPAQDRVGVAQALQTALAQQGIASIPDGEKFIIVVRKQQAAAVKLRPAQIKPLVKSAESDILPAGAINFPNTEINQVITIYAELVGRRLDRSVSPPITPSAVIRFRNQTPLTREEARYALDMVFGLAGLKMVPVGNDLIKPVLINEKDQ